MSDPKTFEEWKAKDGARIEYLEVTHTTSPKLDNFKPNYSTYVWDYDIVGEEYEYKFDDYYEENTFGSLSRMKLAERLSAEGWELVTVFDTGNVREYNQVMYQDFRFVMIFKRRL